MLYPDSPQNYPALRHTACLATPGCGAFVLEKGECRLCGPGYSRLRAQSTGDSRAGPGPLCENIRAIRLAELKEQQYFERCLRSDDTASLAKHVETPAKQTMLPLARNSVLLINATFTTRTIQSATLRPDAHNT